MSAAGLGGGEDGEMGGGQHMEGRSPPPFTPPADGEAADEGQDDLKERFIAFRGRVSESPSCVNTLLNPTRHELPDLQGGTGTQMRAAPRTRADGAGGAGGVCGHTTQSTESPQGVEEIRGGKWRKTRNCASPKGDEELLATQPPFPCPGSPHGSGWGRNVGGGGEKGTPMARTARRAASRALKPFQ